jgi:magnesium-transporting ATPase (P-type)
MLTDKTGTLTQNDMTFKKVRMEIGAFDMVRDTKFKQYRKT